MSLDETKIQSADPDAMLPLLRVRQADLPSQILVVGDPERALVAASLLDEPAERSRNREYVVFSGHHRNVPIGVVSHGVGAAGAAICFEELCRGGVRRIIRAGTAGGMQDHIRSGMIVVATGAVRDDGVTPRIVPLGYPAVPTPDTVADLVSAAIEQGVEAHEGIVLTSDLFYPHDVIGSDLQLWQRAGVTAVEMECSVLFVIAAQHGVETGAVLAIDGNPLADQDEEMAGYNPHRTEVEQAVESTLRVALDALAGGV
jgi:uridine phosphorylase